MCYGWVFILMWASLVAQLVRIHLQCRRPEFHPWVGKIPWRKVWQPTPVFLPGQSPWTEEPGGLHFMGSRRVGHNWVTKHRTAELGCTQIAWGQSPQILSPVLEPPQPWGFLGGSDGKESVCSGRSGFDPWAGKIPWRRKWQSTPVFLQNHCRWSPQPWIKRCLLLRRKAMTNQDSILKSRDVTLPTKVRLVKAMVFPVVIYGCESWTIKLSAKELMLLNCMVLEKTLESSLGCKEIQPVHPKGNQSWIFTGRTDGLILWPPDAKNWLLGKDPDAGKD